MLGPLIGGSTAALSTAGLITELRREAARRLAEILGQERLRELRDGGEAMETESAVQVALARSRLWPILRSLEDLGHGASFVETARPY
jgi:hypothetical protein